MQKNRPSSLSTWQAVTETRTGMWCVNGTHSWVREVLRWEVWTPNQRGWHDRFSCTLRSTLPARILWGICPSVFTNIDWETAYASKLAQRGQDSSGRQWLGYALPFGLYGMKSFCELVRLEKHLICQFDETRLEGGSHGRGFRVRVSLANERVLPSQISMGTLLAKCQKGRFYLSGLRLVIFFFMFMMLKSSHRESFRIKMSRIYYMSCSFRSSPMSENGFQRCWICSRQTRMSLFNMGSVDIISVEYHTWSQTFWWLLACVLGTYVDKSKAVTPRLD